MTMVKERIAVKIAHKQCRMWLENILEREKKGSEILFKGTSMRSALTSVQNMSFQQHFSIKLRIDLNSMGPQWGLPDY